MLFRELKYSSAATRMIFTALVVLLCGMGVMLLSYLVGWAVFGIGLTEIESAVSDLTVERNINFLKVFQALQTIGLFVIPPFIIAWVLHPRPGSFLYLDRKPSWKSVVLVVIIISFSNPLISWLSDINQQLKLPVWLGGIEDWMRSAEEQADEVTDLFLQTSSIGGLLMNLFLVAFLPALGEELLFRGVIQKLFQQMTGKVHIAIWITAAIFSALHMQFYGFLPRMVLGAMFGYMLIWTGSLWAPMLAHLINNGAAVIVYFFTGTGISTGTGEEPVTGGENNLYMVLLSMLFLIVLFRALYQQKPETIESEEEVLMAAAGVSGEPQPEDKQNDNQIR